MLAQRKNSKISINTDMWNDCGGICCKRGPCQYLPIDYAKIMYGEEFCFLRVRTEKKYHCMYYKKKLHKYYHGIEYDKYDEEKLEV